MILLRDAPDGAQLIDSLIEAVKVFSLLYSHTPNEQARLHLESYIGSIEPSIIEAVGASKAPTILNAFRAAVMGRKHEIESSGASRA